MMYHEMMVVLAGGAAHFATGWVLSSDMLFGQLWKKDKSKANYLSKDMRINMLIQFAASTGLSLATFIAICVFQKYQVPAESMIPQYFSMFFNNSPVHAGKNLMNALHAMLFIWAGFIVPTSIAEVIWCGHNLKKWSFEMVMVLIELCAIAATINFLS